MLLSCGLSPSWPLSLSLGSVSCGIVEQVASSHSNTPLPLSPAGADPNVRDHSGKKPRQYMVREETTLSSEAFRSKYAAPSSPLVPQTPPPPPPPPSGRPRTPAAAAAGGRGSAVFQYPPGPQPLPAPPPPGYLEGRRRRHNKGGGILLVARPRRHERDVRDAPEPATAGRAALGWRGRLRESFRGGSRPRPPAQRSSLPPGPATLPEWRAGSGWARLWAGTGARQCST